MAEASLQGVDLLIRSDNSPSSLKHPGYISGQPFTWQEQPPAATWGSVSRWRTLYRETGGNIKALTFQLVDNPLYLKSQSH